MDGLYVIGFKFTMLVMSWVIFKVHYRVPVWWHLNLHVNAFLILCQRTLQFWVYCYVWHSDSSQLFSEAVYTDSEWCNSILMEAVVISLVHLQGWSCHSLSPASRRSSLLPWRLLAVATWLAVMQQETYIFTLNNLLMRVNLYNLRMPFKKI